jgi:hypothetical protein
MTANLARVREQAEGELPVLAMRPGLSVFTAIPSAAQRRAASTANSTFAVLDWL